MIRHHPNRPPSQELWVRRAKRRIPCERKEARHVKSRPHVELPRRRKRNREVPAGAREERVRGLQRE